jgi:hypothetical protein
MRAGEKSWVAVRIVRLNRNDIMQRQPAPFIADGGPCELGLVENLFAHRGAFNPRKSGTRLVPFLFDPQRLSTLPKIGLTI